MQGVLPPPYTEDPMNIYNTNHYPNQLSAGAGCPRVYCHPLHRGSTEHLQHKSITQSVISRSRVSQGVLPPLTQRIHRASTTQVNDPISYQQEQSVPGCTATPYTEDPLSIYNTNHYPNQLSVGAGCPRVYCHPLYRGSTEHLQHKSIT